MADRDESVHIVVDSRESRSGVPERLARLPGVTTEVRELSSGDYVIEGKLAIERKDANDFLLSVMSGRLFDQVARMSTEHERFLVLIEGDVFSTRSEVLPEAIIGALAWLGHLSGAGVVHVPSAEHTPKMIRRLAIHATHGLGYEIALRSAKPKVTNPLAVAQYIVSGLPSVGPTTALTLLRHFGTAQAVFAASRDELLTVKGIGPNTADNIRQALEMKAKQ